MARRLAAFLAVPMAALTMAATCVFPASIPLPDDFAPEGVAVGRGATFYAGSLVDGDIYRGDLRTGEGAVFVDVSDRQAAGLKVDRRHRLLFVAGGATGNAFVYDLRDGSTVAVIPLAPAGASLINDVVVTRQGAWFTDSFSPVLHFVPFGPGGELGDAVALEVTGPAATVLGIGLNGIEATANGRTLIVGHTGLGALFTVDPATGASREIELPAGTITLDTLDGILLDGRTLWTVENFANEVTAIRLSRDLASGTVTAVLTNDDVDGLFRVPTTIAEHGDRLVLVNGRFDLGFPPPFGPGAPPGTDFDVVVVDKP